MALDIARLGIEVDTSDLRGAERDLARFSVAGEKAEKSVDGLGRGASGARASIAGFGTSLRGALVGIAAAAGAFQAAGAAFRSVETYTNLTNSLRAMGATAEEASARLGQLGEIANRTRSPLDATAKLYSRLSIAAGEVGASQQEILQFTEVVGKALAASGTSSQEASGALLQLSQAMAGGTVRAEEFNSILEGAFPIALAAARGIDEAGGSVGRLRQLVVDGKISSEEFFNAILSQSDAINLAFGETSVTVGQSLTVLGNSITLFIGQLDSTLGISNAVAQAILFLGDNLQLIASFAIAGGAAFAASYVPAMLAAAGAAASFAASLFTLSGAIAATGVGALVIGAGLLLNEFFKLIQATGSLGDAFVILGRLGEAVWEAIRLSASAIPPALAAIWARVRADFAELIADLIGRWTSFLNVLSTGLSAVGFETASSLVGVLGNTADGAAESLRATSDALTEVSESKVNDALDKTNRAFKAATNGLEAYKTVLENAKDAANSAAGAMAGGGGGSVGGGGGGGGGGAAGAAKKLKEELTSAQEAAKDMASALSNVVVSSVDSLSDAFANFLTGGIENFQDFAKTIEDTFRNLLKDLIKLAIANPIKIALGLAPGSDGVVRGAFSGLTQQAQGNFAQQVASAGGGASGGGFGGILGQIGGIGSSFISGASGLVSSLFGAGGGFGAAGTYLSATLAGATSSIAGFAAAAGAVALPLAAVVGVISLLRKKTEVLQTGIEAVVPTLDGLVDANGELLDSLDFTVRAFERVKTSNAVSADISKNFKDAGDAAGEMNEAFRQLYVSTFAATEALGISSEIYLDYFRDFAGAVAQFDFKGKDAAGVQEEITRRLADHIDYVIRYGAETDANTARLVDALDRTAVAGETTYDTLVRIANQFEVVSTTLEVLGLRSVGIGVAGAEAADAFVKLFGGLEGFVGALNTYTERFYSEAEQAALITRNLTDQLAAYNVAVPASRAQLRALVDAQDLTTDKGRELAAVLIQNADAFDRILPAASALTATLQDAFGAARETVSAEISALQQLSRDTLASAQLWYRTAQSLRDFIRDLDGTDLGGRTSAQQFASNNAAFNAAVAGAQAGDVEAARSIPALGRALIESARETAQTRADFQFVAARVRSETELAAGIANLTGARDEVLADLYRQSVDVLTAIDTWLSLEGATDEQIAALGDDVKALFRDYAGTLKGFEGDLSALQAAIKDLSNFSYADLQGEIDAVIRIAARADDLPPGLRAIIQDDAREIRATVDFILRNNELTPDLLFLAINPLRESVKTLRFLARSELPPDLIRVALTETEAIRKTVNFVVGADGLDAQAKALALAASSELQRSVTAILRSDQSDPRALRLALGNVGAYRVNVDAALEPGVPDGIRRLVLSQTPTYTAGIVAVVQSDQLSEPARRALLTQQGDYIVSISQVLTDRLSDRKRDLILEAATTGFRFLSIRALDNDLTPRQRALLFDDEPEVRATIRAALDGTRLDGDARRFLRSFTSGADDVTKRIVGRANLGTDEDKLRLVDRLLGAADGNIVLNGGITFDPQASFSQAARGVISGAFSTTATRLALVREALIDVRKSIRDEIPNLADKIVKLRDKVADLDKTLSDPIPTTPVDENTAATPKTIVDAFKLIFQGIGDPTGVIDPTARGIFHTGGIVGERRVTALEGEGIFTPGQMAALAPAPNMDALVVEMRELRKEVERLRRENGSGQAVIASRLKYPDEKAQRDLAGVS